MSEQRVGLPRMPPMKAQKKRILALHGKGDTVANFARILTPIIQKTQEMYEWHIVQGAFDVPEGGFCYWTLEPGERTYQAKVLPGFEKSLESIRKDGPWSAVFGFSQGAMMAALAAESIPFEKVVLVGAAWPTAQGVVLERLKAKGAMCKSLHVIGEEDEVNPPEMAKQVADCFGEGATIFNHKRGHIVPRDEEAMKAYVDFLMEGN